MLHDMCHKYQVTNNFTKDPLCHIFMESSSKIQLNGHDENIACHMSYMSHVTHVTSHKYHVTNILPKTQCVIYFWKDHVKYSSMVIIKMLQVTCVTCNMSHMLQVTNIKLQTILPNTQCVIYFWKAHAKYSSMVMIKMLHVTCVTCYMSQIPSYKQFYERPSVLYIF